MTSAIGQHEYPPRRDSAPSVLRIDARCDRYVEVSQKYRLSQPRISQFRREYLEDGSAF